MTKGQFRAEIVGGGIGGLTAAAALALRGWSVHLHERQTQIREAGAGIYLSENGLRVLEAIGAYDAAIRDSHRGMKSFVRDFKNNVIEDRDLLHFRLIPVVRQDLVNAIADVALRHGAKIKFNSVGVSAGPEGTLTLADGTVREADLILGMDGVGSRIRDSLGLLQTNERLVDGCIRALIPSTPEEFGAPEGRYYAENWNGTRRLLITPLNTRAIYLAFTCLDVDTAAKSVPLDKALWRETFPHLSRYIDRVGDDARWDIFSVIKLKSWSAGHVAISGDAAHAQPPNLGQGGGMSMQNALGLAVALERARRRDDIPGILQEWEQRERPLTEHCQRWSILYSELTTWPDELRRAVMHQAMQSPWIVTQLRRAATSIPTGTPGSDVPSDYIVPAKA
ncbi:MAG TPA: NAD(P)/FAD-dependent oxidoreductase [Magnetospirillaceae bacterium]|jgi:2-polyprenyl-6-methoxyphenol hydroxylase-like FAD-dependent oxidoreductase